MTIEQQKEQFSYAYVRAVAALAGVGVMKPEVDDDSVDLCFKKKGGRGAGRSPQLDAQIKCTASAPLSGVTIGYPLKIKNYDDLRPTDVCIARILILVIVPDDLVEWSSQSEEELLLRRCGYWISLRGEPEIPNEATKTVHIPRTAVFGVGALTDILERIGRREQP